jgi:hypothetical protein
MADKTNKKHAAEGKKKFHIGHKAKDFDFGLGGEEYNAHKNEGFDAFYNQDGEAAQTSSPHATASDAAPYTNTPHADAPYADAPYADASGSPHANSQHASASDGASKKQSKEDRQLEKDLRKLNRKDLL